MHAPLSHSSSLSPLPTQSEENVSFVALIYSFSTDAVVIPIFNIACAVVLYMLFDYTWLHWWAN